MKEIGGYLELDKYMLPMLHEKDIALNSGRNCLAYLIRKKNIKVIHLPKFLCASVADICRRENVIVKYYSIGMDFLPYGIEQLKNEWVYIVNYYGQLNNDILTKLKEKYCNVIIDNVQAYFQTAIENIDTIYTCRKFFGVPDGAFLHTDLAKDDNLVVDQSFEKMTFILGRFEKTASEFYSEYAKREEKFENEDIKRMSKLTLNLLHGIDYNFVRERRSINYKYLFNKFKKINNLKLVMVEGAYMYPLYVENGNEIRNLLQLSKIYIPTLWPDVFELCIENELEYKLAKNILPIPVDQRYKEEDMQYIVDKIIEYL